MSEGQSAGEEKRRSHGEVNLLDGVAGVEEKHRREGEQGTGQQPAGIGQRAPEPEAGQGKQAAEQGMGKANPGEGRSSPSHAEPPEKELKRPVPVGGFVKVRAGPRHPLRNIGAHGLITVERPAGQVGQAEHGTREEQQEKEERGAAGSGGGSHLGRGGAHGVVVPASFDSTSGLRTPSWTARW